MPLRPIVVPHQHHKNILLRKLTQSLTNFKVKNNILDDFQLIKQDLIMNCILVSFIVDFLKKIPALLRLENVS